ncbi:Pyruvate/Phosphoenolpyruvate kinase-like domain-containing protein [Aspergillus cavernicola]|uniref:Pyruvate/Phosphoenolpyruvate kinase-like domain-containing protein n=1 Tax=Aspergillus cavernicola TaxID=176166 RepID=A0ABR4I5P1_9EURO
MAVQEPTLQTFAMEHMATLERMDRFLIVDCIKANRTDADLIVRYSTGFRSGMDFRQALSVLVGATLSKSCSLAPSSVGPSSTDSSGMTFNNRRAETDILIVLIAAGGFQAAAATTNTRNVPTSKAERAAFVLSDEEILQLAHWACTIEKHYGCPLDMEWAKDGVTGELFIVQAWPETVHSRRDAGDAAVFKTYKLTGKKGPVLAKGLSIGNAAVSGHICLIESANDIDQFVDGSTLVMRATDLDWVPIMKRAAAIVTDHGGRTSHAAIISRELGLPAVMGTGNATYVLHTGQDVTAPAPRWTTSASPTKDMLILANPAAAYRWWRLPADGIGLARMGFVVAHAIQVHPMALVYFHRLKDEHAKEEIKKLTVGYGHKPNYFVDKLAHGFVTLYAAIYPKPAILRLSDSKTNEYAGLIGGAELEPRGDSPMLGFPGASRYYSPRYTEGFVLECPAIKRLSGEMGFTNTIVMVPFCRAVGEAKRVLSVMAENGLRRGENGLKVYAMCEILSNVILTEKFADCFDSFSIGSNGLTGLRLRIDRDAEELAGLFSEQNEAVKWMIAKVIAVS